EEITYVEGIWSGGGNFGPNLEAMAFGSELVNNVFIAYGFENGHVKKLDMQVIDVGWGLERVSWFTQGTPTIYEAIFPKAIDYLQRENGYKADYDLLCHYSKLAGLLAVDEVKNLEEERKKMAKKMGLTYEEMIKELGPQEAIYAISDHARTLSITIADGAIPSNVGGGYNLRVLLRRIVALKEIFNLEFSLPKLFDLQIEHLSVSYPRVKKHREDIHKIIDLEVKRYEETKKTGRRIVNQLLQKKKKFNFKTLVDLYQNNGINPLMVKELAKEKNIEVHVPDDFYLQIEEYFAEIKAKKDLEKEKKEIEIKTEHSTYPLYYDDVYKTKFEAKLLEIISRKYLILDKTLFYPTGGGQIHDTGTIEIANKKYKVIDVFKKGSAIVHEIEGECTVKPPIKVKGVIDGQRRMNIMRHHTAVHVVNNAAREVLGQHVWQAGADKTEEKARLDITHYQSISFEELQKIEMVANQIVLEERPIHKEDKERDQAEREYGFQIYQGGVVPGKTLHIVAIEEWDIEACGGTHLNNTGEIGLIKLISSERIQDGVVRLEILAGEPALKYIQRQERILKEASSILSVEPKILPKTVNRFFHEWKEQRKTIEHLNKKIAELQFSKKNTTTEKIKGINVIFKETEGEQKELITQAAQAIKNYEKAVCVLVSTQRNKVVIVGTKTPDLEVDIIQIIKELSAIVGGAGGGNEELAIGGGTDLAKKEQLVSKAKEIIEKNI
ncbi:MAG: alanine--tRNA ligase, partial [Candidatus Heimdallarchaeaceae archaeon]